MYKYAGQGGAVRAAVTAVLAALGLTAAIWVAAGDSARAASADTVLRNGTVLTMDKKDSVASAVAIRKGRIVYTGTDRGVRKWIGKNTKVMNLKGATAMPGMVDGHAHPLLGGDVIDDCDLGNIEATIPELLAVMTECDQADPAKDNSDWLKVSNWNPVGVLPQGTVVTRQDLDTAFPNRPIYIQGSDFHNSWVNSRALEIAGITSETPNPPNGEFVRDELGNPTGLLKDGAQRIVRASIPPKPFDEAVADGLRGIKAMNATGITTTAESVAEPDSFKVWKELNRTGKLSIRMNSFPAIGSEETADQAWKDYRDLQREFEGGRLRLPGIKLVLDGVIEYPAQTAALLKPYLMEDGGQWVPGNNRGELYHSNAQTNALVKLFDQKKRPDVIFVSSSNELYDADRPFTTYYAPSGIGASNAVKQLVTWINKARTELNVFKREEMYHDVVRKARKQAYFAWLVNYEGLWGMSKDLQWQPRSDGFIFVNTMRQSG